MKKVKITIQGSLIYSAHRTFEIEVPDDENVQLYDTNTVTDLADEARVAWSVSGLLLADEHTIDCITDAEEKSPAGDDEKSSTRWDANNPVISSICSLFGIDPNNQDPGSGDGPPASF